MPRKITPTANDLAPEVLVYGFIDQDMSAAFVKEIKSLEKTCSLINVRINSVGGNVYDGIAMFNCVRNAKCAIDMYIDGIAASMASALAMAGRNVYMSKWAKLMTHKPSGGTFGTSDELRTAADEVEALEPVLASMYCQKTGLSNDEVMAKFLNGKDNFFNADQARAAKLVDGIYDGEEVELPETADVAAVYDAFQMKLTASANNSTKNQNSDMRQISATAWAQICMIMAITDSADDAAVVAAIKGLSEKAKKHDQVQAKLTAKETELADLIKETTEKQITAMLDGALKAKKITAQQKAVFAKQYADDADGLKEMLESFDAYVPLSTILKEGEKQRAEDGGLANMTPEAKALFDQGYDKLHKSGKLAQLKNLSEDAYLALYKERYGCLPNEKPFQEHAPKRK